MTATWRAMTHDDLAAVEKIGDVIHRAHPERPGVAADRLRLFPDGCLVATDDTVVIGYCVCHPAVDFQPPALDTVLGALPATADCLYLHDVALLPAAQRRGLGKALMVLLTGIARRHGYAAIALTSVNQSLGYWRGYGFQPVETPELRDKLKSYVDATYMKLAL